MAVVKANAYGHGAMQLAQVMSDFADAFAVATFEEAMELRRVGIEKEILILSPVPHAQYPLIIENGIATVLFHQTGQGSFPAQLVTAGKSQSISCGRYRNGQDRAFLR